MRSPGFTLIELLVVMAIISVLATLASNLVSSARKQAGRTNTQAILAKVTGGIERFRADMRVYPNDRWGRAQDDLATWQGEYAKSLTDVPLTLGPSQVHVWDTSVVDRPPSSVLGPSASVRELLWRNRLYYHLGHDITASERANIITDLDTLRSTIYDAPKEFRKAVDVGAFPAAPSPTGLTHPNGPTASSLLGAYPRPKPGTVIAYEWNDFIPPGNNLKGGWTIPEAPDRTPGGAPDPNSAFAHVFIAQLNRMGCEKSMLLVLAGDPFHHGFQVAMSPDVSNNSRRRVHVLGATPASKDHPGWAIDVLSGEVDTRRLSDNGSEVQAEVLDAYGTPLIYVCQVQPGVFGSFSSIGCGEGNHPAHRGQQFMVEPVRHGLSITGFRGFGVSGRFTFEAMAVGTNSATSCARLLTNSLASDVRSTAAAAYQNRFEVWSAGQDGVWTYRRDGVDHTGVVPLNQSGLPVNLDNVAVEPYQDGLEP